MKGCGKILGCTDVSVKESADNETIKTLKDGCIVMFLRVILCEKLLTYIKMKEERINGICVGFIATFEYLDSNVTADSMTLYAIKGADSVIKQDDSEHETVKKKRKEKLVCLGREIKIDSILIVFDYQEAKQCKQNEVVLCDNGEKLNLFCGYVHIYEHGRKTIIAKGCIICLNYHVVDWGRVILIAILEDSEFQRAVFNDLKTRNTKHPATVCFQDPETLKTYAIGVLIGQRTNKNGAFECVVLPFQGHYKDLADEYDTSIYHVLPSEY